ncbi:MAG TPA: M48 family metallopeptidase [Lacipirellulaceae bacterium]|jgi:Zn-dependent protease with chaperone function|nr:M48 family metallopeptidase [Lacipirellulaceae bacterium]
MATDFFQRQADARRNTKWLVLMFVFAVIAIVGTTMVVVAIAVGALQQRDAMEHGFRGQPHFPWQAPLIAGAAALGLIAVGSLYKTAELAAGGGTVIAERLGGRRVYPNTTDPVERRLLNVVEEMALASGVPVPPTYLLSDEPGINAFAAGFSPSDAIVSITRGCAQQLSRDQLQGVVAHEFSHILNGDMRLNIRLIGVLNGILLMGLVGRELLRWGAYTGGGDRDRRNDSAMYLLLIGLAFMVLGFMGLFIGNLIKAAASRQREFLADASAVQFTRNPGGISGALQRIGAAVFGSKLESPKAAEASHMYFAEGISTLYASHPPLDERIRRIDPQWNGKFPPAIPADAVVGLGQAGASGLVEGIAGEELNINAPSLPVKVVQNAVDQVGNPTELHRTYVQELIAAMPPEVVDAAHEPYGARALIYATLLDENADVRAAQLRALQKSTEDHVFELTLKLVPAVNELDTRALLPLVDMTLPALRALSPAQYQEFSNCFIQLVQADQRLALFEWTLHQILLRHLRPQFEQVRPPQIRYYGLQQLGPQISVLLSTLAHASQHDDEAAFQAGVKNLSGVPVQLLPRESCGVGPLDAALRELAQVAPKLRAQLVDACSACICADMAVSVEEGELLRAICDMLNCPMPPLLPGQEVSPSLLKRSQASQV